MSDSGQEVTICVVPRERFSCAVDSLKSIVDNTNPPYRLNYVDGNSPESIALQLREICDNHGFNYIRENRYLSPNEARNIALSHTGTPFVAFADNDLFVQPGWLIHLLDCALQTDAWAVGPVVLEGSEKHPIIHMTGGDLIEERHNDYNRVRERHRNMFETLGAVRDKLVREPVGSFEFHCVLLRTDVFKERTFLDEGFLALQEHLDLAREIRIAGGQVYFEPQAVVRYDNARAFEAYDRDFFELRWSLDWANRSIEHTREKWNLGPQDTSLQRLAQWTEKHRGLIERSQTPWSMHVAPIIARKKVASWLRKHGVIPERGLH